MYKNAEDAANAILAKAKSGSEPYSARLYKLYGNFFEGLIKYACQYYYEDLQHAKEGNGTFSYIRH
ncbi:MAG: hypothetical protein K5986_05610 [Clostridium sp.]|nr:hypothetical protein [Clostridium sp.]